MTILGIDPGTTKGNKCGWSILTEDEELLEHGYFEYTQTHMPRWSNLYNDFMGLLSMHDDIEYVALEKPYGPNRQSLRTTSTFFGVVFAAMIANEITDYDFYHPAHIKKVVTGDGRASKDDINDYVKNYFNIKEELQKDVADSIAIALCALRDLREEEKI